MSVATRRLALLVSSIACVLWTGPSARLAAAGGGVTRTYYIAADEGTERLLMFGVMGAFLVAALAAPHAFGDDALIFANRPDTTVVGVSHVPTGLYAWL